MSGRPEPQSSESAFADAGGWIEIQRGRTRFPKRPFVRDRFLIGSGSNCDLQLGGTGIPILHSLIIREPLGLRIEAMTTAPPLYVSGWPVRETLLKEGDTLSIGPFTLIVHLPVAAAAEAETGYEPLDVAALVAQQAQDEAEAAALAGLSASELVDRIASELMRIDSQDEASRASLAALVQAAMGSQGEASDAELTRVIAELEAAAREITSRSQQLQVREQDLAARAEEVLRMQERLIEDCSDLLSQQDASPLRKTA